MYFSGPQVSALSPLAQLVSLQTLYFSDTQVSDLLPLAQLSSLHTLGVSGTQVCDLSPLARLSSLHTLDVSGTQVSDLSPLVQLSSLQALDVSGTQVSDLSPLGELRMLRRLAISQCPVKQGWATLRALPCLQNLSAYELADTVVPTLVLTEYPSLRDIQTDSIAGAPPEVQSENGWNDCLRSVRVWWSDLEAGEARDREAKVFVLGNGRIGKTQICRRLRGLGYDPTIPTTHGVQLGTFPLLPGEGSGAVEASLWDFGGQDIYHGTHALFLEGRAIFVIVWNPDFENEGIYQELQSGQTMRNHLLTYWLDYVRSLAGENATVVVVQSQCDFESQRREPATAADHGFLWLEKTRCSARQPHGMELLDAIMRQAARHLHEHHGDYRLPAKWVSVRDTLREEAKTKKTITLDAFNRLCADHHASSVPAVLLSYLHRSGVLFYKEGLFSNEIVLDQEWALRAIYSVFDRNGAYPVVRQQGGTFTPELLDRVVWGGQFSKDEQAVILSMMESCSICFPLHESHDKVQYYAAPDLMPEEGEVCGQIEALWPAGVEVRTTTLEYGFLHEGVLRQFLCAIGKHAGPKAVYWRYGCCFYDGKTHSRARVRSVPEPRENQPARGLVVIETSGPQAAELGATLTEAITGIQFGRKPNVILPEGGESCVKESQEEAKAAPIEKLQITDAPLLPGQKPIVHISYAWGGEKEAMVERLCRVLETDYQVRRDKTAVRTGDWISTFMREVGRGAQVIVVISEKYLGSTYCMSELSHVYQRSLQDKDEFTQRVIPLILEDATISTTGQRLKHVRHWRDELRALEGETTGLEPSMWGGAADDMRLISGFCHHTELMLRFLSDVLMPRGIKDIENDGFAAVRERLKAGAALSAK